MAGIAAQFGCSVSMFIMIGVDVFIFEDPYTGELLYGRAIYFGVGTPGVEGHAEAAYTFYNE